MRASLTAYRLLLTAIRGGVVVLGVLSFLIPALFTAACSPTSGTASSTEPATPPRNSRAGMVQIPEGSFLYGATETQAEFYIRRSRFNFPGMVEQLRRRFVTQRAETIGEFYIDVFEVTNQEYEAFMDSTGYQPKSTGDFLKHWERGSPPEWAATFPVVWVSRSDAQAYCEWEGARLPSEIEWEKAARGTDGRAFPWGDIMPSEETANFASDGPEPAGNRPDDVSPYQVYDMGGNVSEWTASTAEDGPSIFIIRGGSYQTREREMMTCYREFVESSELRRENLGFRCAAD